MIDVVDEKVANQYKNYESWDKAQIYVKEFLTIWTYEKSQTLRA